MHYSIIYSAEYGYERAVSDQHNALRVRPSNNDTQRVEGFDVSIEPAARQYTHTDYFGTEVIEFAISGAHEQLAIRAESRVRVESPDPPPAPSWEQLRTPAYLDAGAEYLGSLDPPANPERIAELGAEARAEDPLQTLTAVCSLIPDRFEYRAGVTYVGSTVNDLLAGGAGVCQDFVHLALTILRREGIACRYVSGYLFAPRSSNGDGSGAERAEEASAEVNTHAWIEVLLPSPAEESNGNDEISDAGVWVGADPTNRALTGTNHIKIGHGRAYSDVPPIRGVYRGTARATLESRVRMTKLPEPH